MVKKKKWSGRIEGNNMIGGKEKDGWIELRRKIRRKRKGEKIKKINGMEGRIGKREFKKLMRKSIGIKIRKKIEKGLRVEEIE